MFHKPATSPYSGHTLRGVYPTLAGIRPNPPRRSFLCPVPRMLSAIADKEAIIWREK